MRLTRRPDDNIQYDGGSHRQRRPKRTRKDVTVTVTNVDEAGTLTLSTLQPVDGIDCLLLRDPDIDGTVTASPTWKWAKSSSKTGA